MQNDFDEIEKIVLIWPHNTETWRKNCRPIRKCFYKLIKIISKYKKVVLIKSKNDICKEMKNVEIVEIESNDSWARDVLPFKIGNNYVGFTFNGYNGILKEFDLDNNIAKEFSKYENRKVKSLPLILEGGGICSDGKICICTKELLRDRNPDLTENQIEDILKSNLKIKHILWIKHGLFADETKGHADEVVAYKNEKELLFAWTDDKDNPNYNRCRENYNDILSFYKKIKQPIIIHKIITPQPLKRKRSEIIENTFRNQSFPVAISYINYLNLGSVIILPQFHTKEDKIAYKQFKQIFKNYKIIKFNSREIALGGGGIHCVTKNY